MAGPAAQVMVVEALKTGGAKRAIAGTPPLFSGFIGLHFQGRDSSRSYVCEMQIDGGDFEPVIEYVGIHQSLFSSPRSLERGIREPRSWQVRRRGSNGFSDKVPRAPLAGFNQRGRHHSQSRDVPN